MYSEKVMDHFTNPRNVGSIDDADGVGEEGNPVCGDMMTFYIKVDDGVLTDVKFKTFGCGAAIAVSSMISEMAKGKTVADALAISNKDVAKELDGLPPQKLHCSNLGADALGKAIKDYAKKNPDADVEIEPRSREDVYEKRFGGVRSAVEAKHANFCCPFCEADIPKESNICEPCGRELPKCPECDENIHPGDHNCPKCGKEVH